MIILSEMIYVAGTPCYQQVYGVTPSMCPNFEGRVWRSQPPPPLPPPPPRVDELDALEERVAEHTKNLTKLKFSLSNNQHTEAGVNTSPLPTPTAVPMEDKLLTLDKETIHVLLLQNLRLQKMILNDEGGQNNFQRTNRHDQLNYSQDVNHTGRRGSVYQSEVIDQHHISENQMSNNTSLKSLHHIPSSNTTTLSLTATVHNSTLSSTKSIGYSKLQRQLRSILFAYLFQHFLRGQLSDVEGLKKDFSESVSAVFESNLSSMEAIVKRGIYVPLSSFYREPRVDLDYSPSVRKVIPFLGMTVGRISNTDISDRQLKMKIRVKAIINTALSSFADEIDSGVAARKRGSIAHFIQSFLYSEGSSFPSQYFTRYEMQIIGSSGGYKDRFGLWHLPGSARKELLITFCLGKVLIAGSILRDLETERRPTLRRNVRICAFLIIKCIDSCLNSNGFYSDICDHYTHVKDLMFEQDVSSVYEQCLSEDDKRQVSQKVWSWCNDIFNKTHHTITFISTPQVISLSSAVGDQSVDDDLEEGVLILEHPEHLLINPLFVTKNWFSFVHDLRSIRKFLRAHYPDMISCERQVFGTFVQKSQAQPCKAGWFTAAPPEEEKKRLRRNTVLLPTTNLWFGNGEI